MKASLAYTNKDLATLDTYTKKTLETAQNLIPSDPLRGNLYAAVGLFLEGAAILQREGTVKGAPQALSRLQQVYDHLDKAEAVSANDPELNLLKGYMDLMLAVNLPFSNPEQAIQRLEKNAAPQYLADRGIALAYRDLKQYSQALEYANRALKVTPDNPESYYLKAQILREQARKEKNSQLMQEAVGNFDKALSKKSQLPSDLTKQIERERRRAAESLSSPAK
jgi:tetratricopeptide (TPR) repeat protein